MRRFILLVVIAAFVFAIGSQYVHADKPRIGVLRFTNKVAGIGWWSSRVASDLQDLMASELASTDEFSVLERKEINAVISEQDLSASGRVSKKTLVKMRRIKGAKYLIAGTVSAFEQSGSTGGKIRFKGIGLGGKKIKTYIAVDVKVIDSETGEIIDTRTIEATIKAKAIGGDLRVAGVSVAAEDKKKTPVGKAIRACIIYISEYLACSLIEGKDARCMKKWNKMEKKRRKKTKSVLSLD